MICFKKLLQYSFYLIILPFAVFYVLGVDAAILSFKVVFFYAGPKGFFNLLNTGAYSHKNFLFRLLIGTILLLIFNYFWGIEVIYIVATIGFYLAEFLYNVLKIEQFYEK